jgi:protein involved in polysaccharide export with SLBB domain
MTCRHALLLALPLVTAFLFTSCFGFGRKQTPEFGAIENAPPQVSYPLGALKSGDTIELAVYDGIRSSDKIFRDELTVSEVGNIEIPKIGPVHVAGKSLLIARETIASAYRRADWASGLRTNIHINSINGNPTFTVEGSINSPGVYVFQENTNILAAPQIAGGKASNTNATFIPKAF